MSGKKKVYTFKKSPGPKIGDAKGVQDSFDYVLKTVEEGWSIYEAVEMAGVSTGAFYKHITEEQKTQLRAAKTSHVKIGAAFKMIKGKEPSAKERDEPDDSFGDIIGESTMKDWNWED